jgi:hypothetical protein
MGSCKVYKYSNLGKKCGKNESGQCISLGMGGGIAAKYMD